MPRSRVLPSLTLLGLLLIAASEQAVGLTRIAVLPLALQTPERAVEGWEGYVIAEMANRALAATLAFAVPEARLWVAGVRAAQQPLGLTDSPEEAHAAGRGLKVEMVAFGGYRVLGEEASAGSAREVLVDCRMVAVGTGNVLFSQSFRGAADRLVEVALKIARRCAEEVPSATLGPMAERDAWPSALSAGALQSLGKGWFYRDRAYAADVSGDSSLRNAALTAAVAHLVAAFNAAPAVFWTQESLMEMCQKVLEVDSANAAAYNNIGLVRQAQRKFSEAVVSFRSAVRCDPSGTAYRLNLANALADCGLTSSNRRDDQLGEAIQVLEEILRGDPNNVAALINLGALELERGNAARAVQELERAVQLAADDAAARLALGLAYARQGNREAARVQLQRAAELDGGDLGRRARGEMGKL